ncbi:hypothetical protein [Lentibacter algarum]|uniref:hypothetical protein n=1 Tax=Lentibacter algarum TaxID=576131 RepID=UPI003AF42399
MSAKKVLVNYRIAENVKAEFERLCRAMQVSMTTQVNLLIEVVPLIRTGLRLS